MRITSQSIPTPYVGGKMKKKGCGRKRGCGRKGGSFSFGREPTANSSYVNDLMYKYATPENLAKAPRWIANKISQAHTAYTAAKTVKTGIKKLFASKKSKKEADSSYNSCVSQCKSKNTASALATSASGIRQTPNTNKVSSMPDMNKITVGSMITNPSYPSDSNVKPGRSAMKAARPKLGSMKFGGSQLMRGPIA